MRILLAFIISFGAFAAELITDFQKVEDLGKRLRESNYENFRRVTPYFYENNIAKVIIKPFIGKKCLKLFFHQNSINYSKISCSKKMTYTLADFPGFTSRSFKTDLPDQEVLLKKESIGASFPGVSFYFFLRDLYSVNLKDFKFNITARSSLISKKGKLTLSQTLTLVRDDFHYFPKKEDVTTQIIDLKEGDMLFQKGDSEFIIYKRYQPKPLDFRFLWLNPGYENYLSTVNSQLFSEGGDAYCFMDYAINPTPYDCQKIAIGDGVHKAYKRFNLIKIDLNGSVNLL